MNVRLPEWRKWFSANAAATAADRDEYELHLAAHEWSLSSALDINKRDDFESLPYLAVEPFAHQVDNAILFFRRLAPRGLIADDVGLGKTITAGLIAAELLHRGRIESMLVVCPKSLMEQWREELESKFGIAARAAVGAAFSSLNDHPFWITSYATARSRMAAIRARKFDLIILDEAHALRNLYGTNQAPQVAQEFLKAMKADTARFAVMLTATPIQNRLWDIYSLLDVLRAPQPNPLGAPDEFRRLFVADADARQLRKGAEQEFRRRVAETTIRTRRADTNLLFPVREVRDELLTPLPAERAYIDKALEAILSFPKLTQYVHTRSLMSSPWAVAASFEKAAEQGTLPEARRRLLRQLATEGRAIRESAKTTAVVEMAKKLAGQDGPRRLIVFTMRIETLNHLATVLEEAGFRGKIGIVQGSQPESNRRAIRDFVADPPPRPILLSTDTGAVGLNLQAGNIVVNYDLPWNPMLIEQRIGRVQRLGQKAAKVIVYNLVLKGTIEDHIVLRLMQRLNLFTQAIGEMEELLELCGYDEERRPLEEVIMDLVRKAAEQKDISEDLRRMEESRRAAEAKMREMRAATEQALASIRPADVGARLTELARVTPRLGLRELIKGCLARGGVKWRETEDARLLVRSGDGEMELSFVRQRGGGQSGPDVRPVVPGTRAFDTITKRVRDKVVHHVLDASSVGLGRVRASLERRLGRWNLVIDDVEAAREAPAAALKLALHVAAEVKTDRYETIVEVEAADPGDGLQDAEVQGEGGSELGIEALPRSSEARLRELPALVEVHEGEVREAVEGHESVRRFCEFYASRYREDLERLAEHARAQGLGGRSPDSESVVARAASMDPAIRTAYEALKSRFVPDVSVNLIGVSGVQYSRVRVQARVRNRAQREAFALQFEAVPLTGVLRTEPAGIETLGEDDEGWACPGGHLTPAREFAKCVAESCTVGACHGCIESDRAKLGLASCHDCGAVLCAHHKRICAACDAALCPAHVVALVDSRLACQHCSVELDDGRRVLERETAFSAASGRRAPVGELEMSEISGQRGLPEEMRTCEVSGRRVLADEIEECAVTRKRAARDLLETSAVSGRRALRTVMRRSERSGRYCLPGEERLCDETGAILLPDEIGICARTGRAVRDDLLDEDAATGERVLRRLLERSEASGRMASPDKLRPSALSGRRALAEEMVQCEVCAKEILPDESLMCPDTGRRGCHDHFAECEATGTRTLPEALARCEATGLMVRRGLLERCAETGKLVQSALLEQCDLTGARVLPEGLAVCSVTGRRVRRSLLATCQESGRAALPQALESCSISGKVVHPDLLVTCPVTGARFLPALGERCEETGTLVSPAALGQCSVTGRRVLVSTLGVDDLTGKAVLGRLLATCEETGQRTLGSNLVTSTVSGKRVLAGRAVRCQETGRLALPHELRRCEVTGKLVHPDLLYQCPETGQTLLRDVAEQCEATGAFVAPAGLGTCALTGKRVRRSLLGTDGVTGRLVQASLLRRCERTGRATAAENLRRSAVSGLSVLADLTTPCEVSGAPALHDELETCAITGKRVLPLLLAMCEASGRRVLRDLLETCQVTGQRVLPQYLERCSRTGKRVLASRLARSELSGALGLAELLTVCETSGRKVFPDELRTSEVSGKRLAHDRAVTCPACGRLADLSECFRCTVCEQHLCCDERAGEMCRACVNVLTRRAGRRATPDEIEALRGLRPWCRSGWVVETKLLTHVCASSGLLQLRRRSAVLVLQRPSENSSARVWTEVLAERAMDREMRARAAAADAFQGMAATTSR